MAFPFLFHQTIITVSFNPLNSHDQYVLQWKEYHQVRHYHTINAFWFLIVLSHSLLIVAHRQLRPDLYVLYSYATSNNRSTIYRNGKLMAKVKRWTRKKWQKLETAKYKPTSKDWILELPTLWDWESWLMEVSLRPVRPVLSWSLTLRRLVVHPSHRVWFCDVSVWLGLCLCNWEVFVCLCLFGNNLKVIYKYWCKHITICLREIWNVRKTI